MVSQGGARSQAAARCQAAAVRAAAAWRDAGALRTGSGTPRVHPASNGVVICDVLLLSFVDS